VRLGGLQKEREGGEGNVSWVKGNEVHEKKVVVGYGVLLRTAGKSGAKKMEQRVLDKFARAWEKVRENVVGLHAVMTGSGQWRVRGRRVGCCLGFTPSDKSTATKEGIIQRSCGVGVVGVPSSVGCAFLHPAVKKPGGRVRVAQDLQSGGRHITPMERSGLVGRKGGT